MGWPRASCPFPVGLPLILDAWFLVSGGPALMPRMVAVEGVLLGGLFSGVDISGFSPGDVLLCPVGPLPSQEAGVWGLPSCFGRQPGEERKRLPVLQCRPLSPASVVLGAGVWGTAGSFSR